MKKFRPNRLLPCALLFALALGAAQAAASPLTSPMTPYTSPAAPGTFIQGAQYELKPGADFGARLPIGNHAQDGMAHRVRARLASIGNRLQ